jgi:hypothetical protein
MITKVASIPISSRLTHSFTNMTRFLCVIVCILSCLPAACQEASTTAFAEPFKPVLDRLAAQNGEPLPDWHFHDDVAHPEDPSLDDSSWHVMTANESRDDNAPNHWKGVHVFRRWIGIPEKINGFHSPRTHRSGALKTLLQDCIPTIKSDQCTISSSGTQKP